MFLWREDFTLSGGQNTIDFSFPYLRYAKKIFTIFYCIFKTRFEPGQEEATITINIIDDDQWEPDETFTVILEHPQVSNGPSSFIYTYFLVDKSKIFFSNLFRKSGLQNWKSVNFRSDDC